jgi:O-antigen/teichoic acid export membrane protein
LQERLTLLRNAASVSVARYLEAATGLMCGVLIARALGPSDYGHYAFGIWLCGLLIMLSNHALPMSAVRFVAEARGGEEPGLHAMLTRHLARFQAASVTLVLACLVAAMLVWPLPDWRDQLSLMVGLACWATWSRSRFWFWSAVANANDQFLPELIALSTTAVLNLAGVAVLAWYGAPVSGFFAWYAFTGAVSLLLMRRLLTRAAVPRGSECSGDLPPALQRRLNSYLLLTGVTLLLALATNRTVEMVLLKAWASAEDVAYFAVAGSLTKGAVDLLAGGMSAVLLPAMSRRYGESGRSGVQTMYVNSARLYWLLGLAVAGLGLTVCEGLIHLLYGHRWDAAIPIVQWHLVIAGFTVIDGAAAAALAALERQGDRLRALAATLVVNVATGLALIPHFGLYGALCSWGLTQVCDVLLSLRRVAPHVQTPLPFAAMRRMALACLLATGAGYVVAESVHLDLAFLGGGLTFVICYLSLCLVLRTLSAGEIEVMCHLLQRVLGSRVVAPGGLLHRLDRFALADPAADRPPAR